MPNPLATIGRSFKRAAARINIFGNWGGMGYGRMRVLRPGSQFDFEASAGRLEGNSAVAACFRWVIANYAEPQIIVSRTAGKGHRDPLDNHPLVKLHDNPNPAMDAYAFWGWIAANQLAYGMGYAYKIRSNGGRVVELWPLHSHLISPLYPVDGSSWLDGWQYRLNGRVFTLPVEDVIPFPWGMPDPQNDRLHVSPLRSAVREICTDNEALTWGAALLKNAGVPALAIVPQSDGDFLTKEQALELKQMYRENFSADAIGDVFVPTGPIKLEKIGYSPTEMNVGELQMIPESRICATLGIHPMAVGLLVGERGGGGGQFGTAREQARKASYEDCLIPLQKRNAKALERHLLPDLASNPDSLRVSWDYSQVQCMQESEDAKGKRAGDLVKAGLIMRSEGRTTIGLDSTPDDEVYYLPSGVTVVTADNEPVEALKPPPPQPPTVPGVGKVGSDGKPVEPPVDDAAKDQEAA